MAHYNNLKAKQEKKRDFHPDCYETPKYCFDMILDDLDKDKVILWEPFPGSGHSTEYMKERGFLVVNGTEDFFDNVVVPTIEGHEEKPVIVLTNPPYSKKKEILAKFKQLGQEKIALFIPAGTISSAYWTELFPLDNHQIIYHSKRCSFLHPRTHEPVQGSSTSFDVLWTTNGLNLPKDIQYKSNPNTIRKRRKIVKS